jgi:hypothetical protein
MCKSCESRGCPTSRPRVIEQSILHQAAAAGDTLNQRAIALGSRDVILSSLGALSEQQTI